MKRPLLKRKRFWLLAALIAAGLTGVMYRQEVAFFLTRLDWQDIHQTVRAAGPWAPILCILLDAAFTVFSLPTTLVGIAIALLFGVGWGLLISLLGLGLGMATSFLIARYLIRDWLERRLRSSQLYQSLTQRMATNGWKLVMFSRLLPINPYSVLNYAYGLTNIRFWPYLLASVIGVIPNVLALLWTVHAAGQLATGRLDARVIALLFAGAGLFALLAWLPRFFRKKDPASLPPQN